MEKNEVGGACSAYEGRRGVYGVLVGDLKEITTWETQ